MSQFAFYRKVTVLNTVEHRNLKISTIDHPFRFARDTTAVLVAGVEFSEASKEYPIVFTRNREGKVAPVVLLGVRAGENLFVDPDGRWHARYVPAFVRRYPFVLAEQGPRQELLVCVDANYEGLSVDHGDLLIGADGHPTQRLEEILAFLRSFQAEFTRTPALVDKLESGGLFRELSARVETQAGNRFDIGSFLAIDEEKLTALPDAQVLDLYRSGAMGLVFLHLSSLGNLNRLLELINAREAAAPAQEAAPPLH